MGTDLLSDIRREIDARLAQLRPALAEYEQLLQAADALGLELGAAPTPAPRARRRQPTPKRTAPVRGATREAILGVLEHGSHTVGELAVVTAMSAASLNDSLRKLASEGLVKKTRREGKIAWSLVSAD